MENKEGKDNSTNLYGINNKTYELLFKDLKNLSDLSENKNEASENIIALRTIELFTRLRQKSILYPLLKILYKKWNIILSDIIYNEKKQQFEYRHNDKVITFEKLSDHIKGKSAKKELLSTKRYGECHKQSICLAPNIDGAKIVTGYISTGNNKILHSIVEYSLDDKTIILDWTRNLYITKEQYVELTNFRELSSFEGKTFLDDSKLIKNIPITIKPYLVFRNEIVTDMMKNIQIFQN